MRRKRIIGVDLIPLRADGSNGGVKHAIIEFLIWIQNNKTDEVQFVYFCNSHTQHEIRNFSRADDVTVCLLALDGVEPVSLNLLTSNDFNEIGKQETILQSFPVDIIYAPLGNTEINYPGTPTISTVLDLLHKDYPNSLTLQEIDHRDRYFRDLISRSDLVQVISNYTKERLVHHYGVSEKRIFVNYLPIHERLSKVPRQEHSLIDEPYFFYPANFWRHKNHETLLIAYYNYIKQQSDSTPWKLVFTGHNDDRKIQVRKHAESLGLSDHVVFLDYISNESLENYWFHAGALVFPSLHEGFGIPLLEAMHYEIPIICHNRTSLSEIGEGASFFCDCRNPLAIASAMIDVSKDEKLRSELISKGRSRLLDFKFKESAENLSTKLIDISYKRSRYLSHIGVYKDGWIGKQAIFNIPDKTGRAKVNISIPPTPKERFVSIFLDNIPFGSYDISLTDEIYISFYAYMNRNELKIVSSETSIFSSSDSRSLGIRLNSVSIIPDSGQSIALWETQ